MKVRGTQWFWFACLAGTTIWPRATLAQTDNLRLELARCADVTDINARVACYDGLAHPQQGKPPSSQAPRAKAAAEPTAARIENFGQPQARLVPDKKGDAALLEKVASIKELPAEKLQITLANGQVWQQTVGKAFFINVGDNVRIESSGWGRSFRLAVEGHPDYIQVSRLR
jgi:hypothetical protein